MFSFANAERNSRAAAGAVRAANWMQMTTDSRWRPSVGPQALPVLRALGRVLKNDYPGAIFVVGGHTDSAGKNEYNQDLSERRAKAVLDYMKVRVDTTKYTSVGYGETKPIESNDTDEGKQKNRRVEFNVK